MENTLPVLVDLPCPIGQDSGAAYFARIGDRIRADDLVFLLEDGAPIGRASAPHKDIRALGASLFSIWRGVLYFSASASLDCNANGRPYHVFLSIWKSMKINFYEIF
jgi:hypothetical protein